MPQTIVEKIAQAHMTEGPSRLLRAGDFLSIRPHRVMTHDNTSAVMSKFKGIGAKKVRDHQQLVSSFAGSRALRPPASPRTGR